MNKREKSRSIIAATLALAILFASTFAWNAISQLALNEIIMDASEYGGRLHDDFDGINKKVYVENYTDADSEMSIPVFARIRLDEYMELGEGAGTLDETLLLSEDDIVEGSDNVEVINNSNTGMNILRGDLYKSEDVPNINDKSTWDTYLFKGEDAYINPFSTTQNPEGIRYYRELQLGGSTVYMPTFNKDNTSLEADVNGTMEGDDGLRFEGVAYDDFIKWNDGDKTTQDAYYYYEEGMELPESYKDILLETDQYTIEETHTATKTRTSTIISMEEWKDLHEDKQAGDMWVYDVDGWAYWASPIMPDECTGLLLDKIIELNSPIEEYYYAIHVTSQIATANDWGNQMKMTGIYAEEDSITEDGEALLDFISNVSVVRVSIIDAETNELVQANVDIEMASVIDYSALVTGTKHTEVTWTVRELASEQGTSSGVSMASVLSDEGTFTASPMMVGYSYEITASSSFREDENAQFIVSVYDPEQVNIDITVGEDDDEEIDRGTSTDVDGSVSGLNKDDVDWEITGSQVPSGNIGDNEAESNSTNGQNTSNNTSNNTSGTNTSSGYDFNNSSDNIYQYYGEDEIVSSNIITSISKDGLLTISPFEPVGTELTIIARSTVDGSISAKKVITVKGGIVDVIGTNNTIVYDDTEFYVLGLQLIDRRPAALLYTADAIEVDGETMVAFNIDESEELDDSTWESSNMRLYLSAWLNDMKTLRDNVASIKVATGSYTDINGITRSVRPMENTVENVFLLSYDEFENYIGRNNAMSIAKYNYWLRTPNSEREVWGVTSDGSTYKAWNSSDTLSVRPAVWVYM